MPSSTCYGRTDVELAPDAVDGLAALAQSLRARIPDDSALFTSPLRRCVRLAQHLQACPTVDNRLSELDFGTWELRGWDEIPSVELDAWAADPLDYRMPCGESVACMRARVCDFLNERAARRDARITLITHAGVLKVAFGIARGARVEEWMNWRFEHGSLHVLEWPSCGRHA